MVWGMEGENTEVAVSGVDGVLIDVVADYVSSVAASFPVQVWVGR